MYLTAMIQNQRCILQLWFWTSAVPDSIEIFDNISLEWVLSDTMLIRISAVGYSVDSEWALFDTPLIQNQPSMQHRRSLVSVVADNVEISFRSINVVLCNLLLKLCDTIILKSFNGTLAQDLRPWFFQESTPFGLNCHTLICLFCKV
jgi:hypothetical protein